MTVDVTRLALQEAIELLRPLTALADSDDNPALLNAIGWDAEALGLTDPTALSPAVASLDAALNSAGEIVEREHVELADLATALGALGPAAAQLIKAISSLPPAAGVPADALAKVGADLTALLIEHDLVSRYPAFALAAALLGIFRPVQKTEVWRGDGTLLRSATRHHALDLATVPDAVRDPLSYARATFLHNPQGARRTAEAAADLLGPELVEGLIRAGLSASYGVVPPTPVVTLTTDETTAVKRLLIVDASVPAGAPGTYSELRLGLGVTDDTTVGEGLGFLVATSASLAVSLPTRNGTLSGRLKGATQPVLLTGKSVRLASGAASGIQLDAGVEYAAAGSPAVRLGSAGTRVEVGKLHLALGITSDGASVDLAGGVDLTDVLIAVRGGDGDSFLSRVLPQDPLELRGDLGLDLSLRKGFAARGGANLEWRFGVGRSIGPLEIREGQASVGLSDGSATLGLTTTLALAIGPLFVTIDSVGLAARLRPAAAGAASLGPFELAVGFQPPKGLGIAVGAGPVAGGGYISFDAEKGRYSGVLQLNLAEISVTAIGLLDTRLPGGAPGYSFLIIVAGTFPPIQLGLGFTLTGIGGLAGIHRTMVVETIQAGIRAGSVDHILFPEDPVRDAPQIISDLQSIFPPVQGRFVFGPMAILGYGSGPATLLEAELGILLEVPAPVRLVILGQLRAQLPSPEAAVLVLQLDVLGVVDFGRKTLALDAVLHDSRLQTFPLFGDMALRMTWAETPSFAFAIGGFNPRFQPPPGFPALRRLTLAVAAEDGNPSLLLQLYFALTSNTAQIGARGDLSAQELGFTLTGWLGFDVLATLEPFSLVADLSAGAVVKKGQTYIASVTVEGTLTGPAPWHLLGRASFDCIVHYTVPINRTIGEAVAQPPPPPLDPWPPLQEALQDARNWRAEQPPAGFRVCSLRAPADPRTPLLDPLGGAAVHEKVVPLNRELTRFGEAAAAPPGHYRLGPVTAGTSTMAPPLVQDHFAAAQFEQLDDAARLSRPAFEKMDAGFALASDALDLGAALSRGITVETLIVDRPDTPGAGDGRYTDPAPYAVSATRQMASLEASASAQAPLATTGKERYAPPFDHESPARLIDERFAVVFVDTLVPPTDGPATAASKGAALQALGDYVGSHPRQRGRLQVIPEHEMATA